MNRTSLLIPFAFAVAISACVSVATTPLGTGTKHHPVPWNQVAVYRSAETIPGSYEEVALLSAKGDVNDTDEEGMVKKMRASAGKVGANGLILGNITDPSTGARIANAFFGTGADRTGKAIAIYVPQSGEVTARPAAKTRVATPAAVEPSTSSPKAAGKGATDAESRLEKLKSLRARGLITEDEYARKRKEIIDSM